MKRVRWKLTTGVVVALILTSVGAAGGSQSEASTSVRRTHYSLQPMSIQFNTKGGGGNAFIYYNANVADTSSNNAWTRLNARGAHVATVSLNELCFTQYQRILWMTAVAGYPYGEAFFAQATTSVAKPLRSECGASYGTAALVNGGRVGNPAIGPYVAQSGSEARGVACVRNYFYWSCSTHLHPGNTATTGDQEAEFRGVAAFLASGGFQTFAAGDFNIPYPSMGLRYVAWSFGNGFVEADHSLNRSTHASGKIDYLFRKSPGSWSHGAYVTSVSWSDHDWLQGYL